MSEICCLCFPDNNKRLITEFNKLIEQYRAKEGEVFYVVCQVADTKNNKDPRLQLTREQYNSLNLIGKDVLVEHDGAPCGKVVLSWHRHRDHENYGICAVLEINKTAFPGVEKSNLPMLCGEVSLATTRKDKKALEVSLVSVGARPGTVAEYPENLVDLINAMHLNFGFAQYGKCYKRDKMKKMTWLNALKLSNEEIIRASRNKLKMDSDNSDTVTTLTTAVPQIEENSEAVSNVSVDTSDETKENVLKKFEEDEISNREVFEFIYDVCSKLNKSETEMKETQELLNKSCDRIFSHVTGGLNKDDNSCKKLIEDWKKLKEDSRLGTKHLLEQEPKTRHTNRQLNILKELSSHLPTYKKKETKKKLWEYMIEAGVIKDPENKITNKAIEEKTNQVVKASAKRMAGSHQLYTTNDGGHTFLPVKSVSVTRPESESINKVFPLGDSRLLLTSQQSQQPTFVQQPSSSQVPADQYQSIVLQPQPQQQFLPLPQNSIQTQLPQNNQLITPFQMQYPHQQQGLSMNQPIYRWPHPPTPFPSPSPQGTYWFNNPQQWPQIQPSRMMTFEEAYFRQMDEIKQLIQQNNENTKKDNKVEIQPQSSNPDNSRKRKYDSINHTPSIDNSQEIIKASAQQMSRNALTEEDDKKFNTWGGKNK